MDNYHALILNIQPVFLFPTPPALKYSALRIAQCHAPDAESSIWVDEISKTNSNAELLSRVAISESPNLSYFDYFRINSPSHKHLRSQSLAQLLAFTAFQERGMDGLRICIHPRARDVLFCESPSHV